MRLQLQKFNKTVEVQKEIHVQATYLASDRKKKDKEKVEEVSDGWLKKNQKSNLIMTLPSLYLLLTKPVNIFPTIQPLELIFTCHL